MSNRSKAMMPPINCIFNYLQQQTLVTFWLYEQVGIRIRGKIAGFDEFMNVVIDDALEVPVDVKTGKEKLDEARKLGRILLKGDNITLLTSVDG
ncbi:hypothetical protein Kpol_218p3 [Vanderwaltozyma polyspora DSM 70294]|uniref:Small nuclear ribonucleoprotein E n=1 Tax=Vanderwaltozyma polyspora (strain ATCC 22028 / DSM 70294 / BCRC 21397 / CBS 2163 / NBRC 10782 / NRRL Y-8283 / UCD 57-17) TaxID=436907 RepID=A7TTI9_VANPO|nr:uncharacterized protein Kpol_218p3 [Vanderwaltozyma polyspora DSM 70294]EDO14418.1 hypothetical protein Kpol_218p3 [Vanderwaltozyma polyspora DSM 70294]